MTLSIIIVNYNVRCFLEQCLFSVLESIRNLSAEASEFVDNQSEIIVVDNQSQDGSIAYLQPKFPDVRFIANPENTGFGRANNLALALARGKYVLFLNPDTIVPEDCFRICIRWMESHPNAGACGVRMIAGNGEFLKESRRGFPGPWASFYKLSGITSIFPNSKRFAAYYLGHLSENEVAEAAILSGAFLFAQKSILEQIGGFDEQFFMYAEDIDLSYRLKKAGYANYYLPTTTIIHFKGESTRKDIQYVKLFYRAMIQFSDKHFRETQADWYRGLMKGAIWMRGSLAAFGKRFKKTGSRNSTTSLFLKGDPVTTRQLASKLSDLSYPIEKNESAATSIVLCQGREFSFKEMINTIKSTHPDIHFFFHASGSVSVVGSESRNEQGETIAL